jgi:SAM-dependent methyltransferase
MSQLKYVPDSPAKRLLKTIGVWSGLRRIAFGTSPLWGRILRPLAIRRYFNAYPAMRKLQIGCQLNLLSGWLNTDLIPLPWGVVYLDATKEFPFTDQSFDYVFSEHMIEHVPYKSGCLMLRECFRVLKPGGKLRIATPNLRALVALLAEDISDIQRQYILSTNSWAWGLNAECIETHHPILAFNHLVYLNGGHRFIWDFAIFRAVLPEIGFVDIVETEPCLSSDVNLRDLEFHWRFTGHELNRLETLVIEARRPVIKQEA